MRQPKPFKRKQTGTWYVQIGKKQINLGADKTAALASYNSLMAGKRPVADDSQVIGVLAKFGEWNRQNRSAGTREFYRRHLDSFSTHVGPSLTVEKLKPHHITDWIGKAYPNAGGNYRRNAIRCIQRAFNWAVDEGHLAASPIKRVKKPAYTSRDAIVRPEQWAAIVADQTTRGGGEFLDFMRLLRLTGCRPLEARTAESRHLDRKDHCLVFDREESKGKAERRVIPLVAEAFVLVATLAIQYPEGPLFRNEDGNPWTRRSIGHRLTRISKRLKCKTITAYSVRHTWATEFLERGGDPITCAKIMGHKSLTELMKTYAHVEKNRETLRQTMAKVMGQVA